MSDIQYVQRPFQQFCTKNNINMSIMFYTTYHYVPQTITHAPRFPRKITIHVHHVPRQITMFPAFFQNKPQVFQHVSMNLQETSTVSTIFPSIFQHVPFHFPTISGQKSPFSTQKMPLFPGFFPGFSQLQPFHRGTAQRRWPRGAALARPAAWPPGASARPSPAGWRGAPSMEKWWITGVGNCPIIRYMVYNGYYMVMAIIWWLLMVV